VPELANQARCHDDLATCGLNEEVDSQRVGWPASAQVQAIISDEITNEWPENHADEDSAMQRPSNWHSGSFTHSQSKYKIIEDHTLVGEDDGSEDQRTDAEVSDQTYPRVEVKEWVKGSCKADIGSRHVYTGEPMVATHEPSEEQSDSLQANPRTEESFELRM